MNQVPNTLADAFKLVSKSRIALSERLNVYGNWLKELRPEIAAEYDRLVDRLTQAKAGHNGPKNGSKLPPFVMPDQDGRLVDLDGILSNGPAVISFNRGHWCSFCRLELMALAEIHEELDRLGARTVSIVPLRQNYARKLKEQCELPFDILSDVEGGYTLSLGLLIDVGADVKRCLKTAGVDLSKFNSGSGWLLPIPATYVVGQDCRILASHVDPNFRKRMATDQIIEAVKGDAAA